MADRGFTDKVKGKTKMMAGNLTGNQKVKAQSVIHRTIGMTKEVVSDVKDVAEEVIEKVKDKMSPFL